MDLLNETQSDFSTLKKFILEKLEDLSENDLSSVQKLQEKSHEYSQKMLGLQK